jgi:SAM-dependent methyltransferase
MCSDRTERRLTGRAGKQIGVMADRISPRLAAIVEALPLRPGMRVLEIGCGPGVAARAVLRHIGTGHVLGIDRSAKAIAQAISGSTAELASGQLEFRCVSVEDLVLGEGERPYDLAFAVRVGALDGRHPVAGRIALGRIRQALVNGGPLFVDGGNPLRTVTLDAT